MTVRVIDKGYAALFQRLRAPAAAVTVGVHEDVGAKPHPGSIRGRDKRSPPKATIADVATWLEVGTSRAPRRSFVADWADENEERNRDLLRKLGHGLVTGQIKNAAEGLRLFGEKAKQSMVRRMGDGIPPPNASSTIARKGSETPGVDSGEVRKAIDFKVT